ncbi:NADPH:quinone reductase [Sphingomonas laterariae]|uniref:NADPH:quinone reductase n=1 Tax=Edaphosphingomonas laterariae TaxID=861865 RepID=A0A239FEP5_9SPHN|nr:NAD(P)-dependent alcohol dehydrogenase [Sphingomonas laterariae]SNS55277.1 NADPH:quinone reductase [Sphingomonas laterariae]
MTRSYRLSRQATPLHPGAALGLAMTEGEQPQPGAGEVLVRVRASALNFVDLTLLDGSMPGIDGRVPLLDGAGEVVAVGAGVTRWRPGDRVIANPHQNWIGGLPSPENNGVVIGCVVDGMLRDHACLPESGLVAMPDGLSFEEAASLPCAGLSAWNSILGGPSGRACKPGDTVLTLGTGGVSLFAVQFAKAAGCRVIATTSNAAKAELLRGLGADQVIDYGETPEWGAAVLEATGGRGVDLVVEVGGPNTLPQSLRAVRTGGRLALIGIVAGMGPLDYLPLLNITTRTLTIFGNGMGSRDDLEAMLRAVRYHGIRPTIDKVFDFDQAVEAMGYFAARRHVGKVVIRH